MHLLELAHLLAQLEDFVVQGDAFAAVDLRMGGGGEGQEGKDETSKDRVGRAAPRRAKHDFA